MANTIAEFQFQFQLVAIIFFTLHALRDKKPAQKSTKNYNNDDAAGGSTSIAEHHISTCKQPVA
jgi:hypothetical protein